MWHSIIVHYSECTLLVNEIGAFKDIFIPQSPRNSCLHGSVAFQAIIGDAFVIIGRTLRKASGLLLEEHPFGHGS